MGMTGRAGESRAVAEPDRSAFKDMGRGSSDLTCPIPGPPNQAAKRAQGDSRALFCGQSSF